MPSTAYVLIMAVIYLKVSCKAKYSLAPFMEQGSMQQMGELFRLQPETLGRPEIENLTAYPLRIEDQSIFIKNLDINFS